MILIYLRRELRRRRKAQLVIALGLALGIALVVVVNAVSSGMRKAQDDVLESLYGLGTDMTVAKEFPEQGDGMRQGPRFEFGAEDGEEQTDDVLTLDGFDTLESDAVDRIAAMDGVSDAVGALALRDVTVSGNFDPGTVEEGDSEEATQGERGPGPRIEGGGAEFGVDDFTVLGTDVSKPGVGPLSGLEITEGRSFETDEKDANVALVDANQAASEELAVGDAVTMKGTDFEIVGLVEGGGEGASDVYVPLARAQQLAEYEGEVSTVYVQATDSQQLDAVEAAINDEFDEVDVVTADDMADQVSGSLATAADLADGVGTWLSYIVLGTSFVVAGLMASSAVSRRVREFGTLKALGWTRRRITGQVMGESLVTGLFGGAIGLGLALLTAWTITTLNPSLTAELASFGAGGAGGPGGGPVIAGETASSDAAGSGLDIGLTAPVSLDMLLVAVSLAVAGGLIAGAFAASRASRLRPADALRRVA
ncbi:ABC transporter permease [Streptomyces sp. B6B3]|uniref:ABC transporter permease n=1 Tax=Streptomyces sp. B6B3 TaxID=3153570 RepID=UPI00325D0AD7